MPISLATSADIPSLVKLVNSAYRGEQSKKGWTTEAELLGGIRIDEETMTSMINTPGAVVLKYTNEEGLIEGCVYLEKKDNYLYLGMLSVSPLLQASGIGKKILAAAEDYAVSNHCTIVGMTVISVRNELIAWYERYGYKNTGITKPFPTDEKFGVPVRPLEFIVMEKVVG